MDQGVGRTRRSVLHILIPQQDYDAAWWSAFAPPLLVGVATLSAVALAVHLISARLSRVLARLGGEVQRLAEGDFSDVESPAWNDEASNLARAVNQTARQLRDYENELRRTERLQAVAMIGAGLAHEMRNAATGCRLAIDLHHDECERSADDESLEVARRQLLLMEGRLQQLLQVGKPSQNSNREPIDFGSVVEESAMLAGPAIRHAHVSLEWVAPKQQVVIEADPELVGQAVMNLLLNALDAAAKVSATACDAGRISMDLDDDGDHCELRVSDNGAGPRDDGYRDVFEPFVTEKPEGVGLGLAVAKRIVESYEGVIHYQREGLTTVFCIRPP